MLSSGVSYAVNEKKTLPPDGLIARERILNAAARLFRDRGYKSTTVRDIAAEVGILSGSLFYHFKSKEQMLVEMVREAVISMCVGAERLIAPISDPVDRLRVLVRFELDCFAGSQTRDYFAVMVSEWRDVPVSVQPEMRVMRQRYQALVRTVIDECDAAGLLRLEPDAAAKVLHGATTGAVTWFRSSGRYGVEEFARILADLVLRDPLARSDTTPVHTD